MRISVEIKENKSNLLLYDDMMKNIHKNKIILFLENSHILLTQYIECIIIDLSKERRKTEQQKNKKINKKMNKKKGTNI